MPLKGIDVNFKAVLQDTNKCQGFRTTGEDSRCYLKVFITPEESIDVEISEEDYNTIRELNNEQTRQHKQKSTTTD